jgi:hypothetical protein
MEVEVTVELAVVSVFLVLDAYSLNWLGVCKDIWGIYLIFKKF